MKQKICRECGHVFAMFGRDVEVRRGFTDDYDGRGEIWHETFVEHLCADCSKKYPYDAEWNGVYFKEFEVSKEGVIANSGSTPI